MQEFETQNPAHAAGVPFHVTCLEMFRRVSLYRNGKILWGGLCELGMHKNHEGFKNIERDSASDSNHYYLDTRRENSWLHIPATELGGC